MNALIFGAGGQDGYYLDQLCRRKDIQSIGVSRSGDWVKGDVSCLDVVEGLVRRHTPDLIFHLAATSSTRHATVFENHGAIATGTLNILEAVYRYSRHSKVFICGSGVQFENKGRPISEHDAFAPLSPYAVARIHSVHAARYYRSLGVKAYVGYLFHHESPLRKPEHTSQMIVQAVRRIAQGDKRPFQIGDLTVEKEWTFAGDVVQGIFALVEQEQVFEAVIGSGVAYSIRDWTEQCFKLAGVNDWEKYVEVQAGYVPEYPRLVSDSTTISALGWVPEVDFPKLAQMMLNAEVE